MFTIENLITLFFLIILQIVLGFDNLLYISLESKKAPEDKRVLVRRWGIGIAIFLRLILLFIIMGLIDSIKGVLFSLNIDGIIHSSFNPFWNYCSISPVGILPFPKHIKISQRYNINIVQLMVQFTPIFTNTFR